MQTDRILEKAKQLGIDSNNLEEIAEQVGIANFDAEKDLNRLENKLDDRIASDNFGSPLPTPSETMNADEIPSELEPPSQKFGQAEYNAAKDENGVYDPDYYKKRQEELDQKIGEARDEKNKQTKEVPDNEKKDKPTDEAELNDKSKEENESKPNGNNDSSEQQKGKTGDDKSTSTGNQHNKGNQSPTKTINKNALDRAKDRANLNKAKLDSAKNKLDSAKAKAYNATHPGEALKNKAKSTAKNAVKKVENKAKTAIVNLIKKNPYVLLIILGAGLFFILMIMIFAAFTGDKSDGSGGSSSASSYNTSIGTTDGIPFNSTTLSKQEFKERFAAYIENHPTSYPAVSEGRQVFLNNIDLIYDTAVSYNINPEIIVIRATLEGFSPGRDYNYWGMGCTNTGGGLDCTKYDSFQEGVRVYAEKATRFSNYTEMISQYGYLGEYWYNPGSSAQGGCYYLETLKPYMSTSRYNEVYSYCSRDSYICTKTETSNCLKTIEEDYDAYVQNHIQIAIKQRKTIFGLDPVQSYQEIVYSGNYIINPDDKLYSGLKTLHGDPPNGSYSFEQLLTSNGQTIESYNAFLKNAIEKAGVGTRNGVVTAAMTLIGSMAEMGYKINYRWGGKYGHIGVNKNWGNYSHNSCELINPEKADKCAKNYQWGGFDCSGFVWWALVNGMQNESLRQQNTETSPSSSNQRVVALDENRAVCRPGGVLVSEGHIVLVVGVDVNKKKYIIAESTGNYISQDTGGVRLHYYSYKPKGYVCKNLEEIYGD